MLLCTNTRSTNYWHDKRHRKGFIDDLQHLRSEIPHAALFPTPKTKARRLMQAGKERNEVRGKSVNPQSLYIKSSEAVHKKSLQQQSDFFFSLKLCSPLIQND